MRKILSLFAAVLVALVANSAVIQINNSTPDALRLALGNAAAGDVIEMAAGTYVESNGNYIAVDAKDVIVRAAEGAEVTVQAKVPVTISNGGRAEFIGIKFDASHLQETETWYPAVFYVAEAGANKLILDNCEVHNSPKYMVYATNAGHLDSCVIKNCYFHDGVNSAIWMQKHTDEVQACDHLIIANSTFATFLNMEYPLIRFENINNAEVSDAELQVDHCTFYNHTKNQELTYGFIDSRKSTNNLVSNCIFVNPQIPEGQFNAKATQLYGGTVLKCLRHNVPAHRLTPAEGNDIEADPLFVDAANGDLHLSAGSPAIGAGTDGSTLGDPRWYPIIGAPEYYLVGTMNNWAAAEAYKFTANSETEGEYMLSTTLAEGDSLKVIGIVGNTTTWYPDNAANYVVDAAHAGEKTIYFRPDGQGGSDWYYGVIYIAPNEVPSGIIVEKTMAQIVEANNYTVSSGNNATCYTEFALDEHITVSTTGSANCGSFWSTTAGTDWRLYQNKSGNITITAANGYSIKSLVITYNQNNAGILLDGTTAVASDAEQTINAASKTYTVGNEGTATNGQVRVIAIKVVYEEATPEPEVHYYMKNNWEAGEAWTWKEMAKDGNVYKLDSVVFGGTGVNVDVAEVADNAKFWFPVADIQGAEIAAKDTVSFVFNPADTTVTATMIGKYVEPVVGCDWDKLEFLGNGSGVEAYTNCYKICVPAGVNVVNIQSSFGTEPGIYVTFPSDVFGPISMAEGTYATQGAGMLLYVSAFTAKETEVTVNCASQDYVLTVYNKNGIVPATPKFYVTGDSALVVDAGATADKAWAADAVPSMNDTLALNLKANQYYILKVVDGANWYGYNELTEKAKGLKDDNAEYHNIGFSLAKAGEVKVIYKAGEIFKLIGNFYVEPVIPAWAEVRFAEEVAKSEANKPLNDSVFTVKGSALTLKAIDTAGKMAIDANEVKFGTPEEGYDYALRLKSGGKSSDKNYLIVNVPEDGELVIAARTSSGSDTTRTVIVKQGADTLYNAVVRDDQRTVVTTPTDTTFYYPYIVVPVAQGQAEILYPIGAINFYGVGFRTLPVVNYYMKNNWNAAADWTWKEMTKDGKVYKLDSVVYGGNGVNYNIAESDEGAAWVPDSAILGADIEAKDTVSFVLDPTAKTVTATLIGKYVKPAGEVSCAEIYALADSAAVLMNGVVVTYVNGANVYVKDATGAMLIYMPKNTTAPWKAGDIISNVHGMKVSYSGLAEVKPSAEQVAAVTVAEGAAPAPEELAEIKMADINKYIKILNIEVAADTAIHSTGKATNIDIIFGNDTVVLRNTFLLEQAFAAGKKYDITGVISYYVAKNATVGTLQVFPIVIEEHVEPTHTYTVAGSPVAVFGSSWTPSDTLNDMTLAEGDSLYRWEKANLTLAAGEIAFKVAEDHAWTHAWPASDYKLPIAESGIYTIKITFNPATQVVAAEAIKTGEAVVIPVVQLHGTFTNPNWATSDAFVLAADSLTASLALTLEAKTYEFGMKFDGTWKANGANLTRENPSTSLAEGNGNMHMDADLAGEYIFTYTFASQTLAVTYPSEPMDSIPTTAPAAPTAAEEDVLAIYCNKYTNNNLNFAISGWAGGFENLDIEGTKVGYRPQMTWECIIDPVHTDDAHDMSGYKKLHVDIWAPKAAKIKFTVEAVAGGNYKDGNKVDLVKGWNAFDFVVAEWPGNYDFKNVKCFVWEQYQDPTEASFEGNPFAFANIYFYEKESQDIDNIYDAEKAVKVLRDGQIYIIRGDKVYTVMGQLK